MNAIQQKCRPKHQVLVLKCYPRTTKGAVDVKPNSSELSYLLFYATSRRTKIQKVGSFLEKKTASDVWRLQIGRVQVTLQILAALIEKSPKDLPLFAQNVLTILGLVLQSNDITMVEASLPTFETFCEHHDASSLFADQSYVQQYEGIVRAYAKFASTRQTPGKGIVDKPIALRWRNAGLEAIKSVAESETLSSVAGRQLEAIVPVILENLWTDNEGFLDVLVQRLKVEEKGETTTRLGHRPSLSIVTTAETPGDTNPVALTGSAADTDRLAEEETGLAAMRCLKQIFVVPNRAQLHGATTALIEFIRERIQQQEVVVKTNDRTGQDCGWAIKIFGLVAGWAAVQDRYIILTTAMETLVKTQPTEDKVSEQTVLVAMISSLLRSDVNLIGLSVMDILLGLVQQIKRVLKQSGRSSQNGSKDENSPISEKPPPATPTPQHRDLLLKIQQCIGDLATHVYYADQISDMISAILIRLKPHPSMANASPPTEKAEALPANSVSSLSEDQRALDSFFAFDLAKTTALRAIKGILLVANPQTKMSGNISLTRNRVPIQVWEGTHWLLRDPDGQVRKAYADALVTWLDRETTRADLRARDESQKSMRVGNRDVPSTSFSRRVVSATSNREKPAPKVPRSHFLQLIHLAVYDNALHFVEYETDIVLCHVLLAKLVEKMGINAVRYGLPMVYRLQEDIQEAETPLSKVRLGALCHGYFWAVSEKFEFETSIVGHAVQNEIVRRRSKSFWVEGINVPPPQLDTVGTPGTTRPQPKLPIEQVESEALLPFDDRISMVECICTNYQEEQLSPPGSPASSPGRIIPNPISGSSTLSTIPPAETQNDLPSKFREDMMAEWSREAVVISLQEESKTVSLDGSKHGTTPTKRDRLAVNGQPMNGDIAASPVPSQPVLRPAIRKASMTSRGSGRSSSSRSNVATVDQLKMVLTGEAPRPQTLHTIIQGVDSEEDSDSMASYDLTPSELSYNTALVDLPDRPSTGGTGPVHSRSKSRERKASGDLGGPLTSHPTVEEPEEVGDVPPVPPIPISVTGNTSTRAQDAPRRPRTAVSTKDYAMLKPARRNTARSRNGDTLLSSSLGDSGLGGFDLQSLLKGIDSNSKEHTLGNLTTPPY